MLLPASATSSTSPSPHPMVVPRGWGSATSPAGAYPPLRPPRAHAPPPVTVIAAAVPALFSSSSSTPGLLWAGRWWSRQIMMGRETVLRRSLVCLGAAVCLVGLATFSFKKTIATYVFGILAICGVVLPDWEFFDRDFSQWFSPMPADRPSAGAAAAPDAIRSHRADKLLLGHPATQKTWLKGQSYERLVLVFSVRRFFAHLTLPNVEALWFLRFFLVKIVPFSVGLFASLRFKFYPLRVSLFVVVYSLGLYKWWSFVSS